MGTKNSQLTTFSMTTQRGLQFSPSSTSTKLTIHIDINSLPPVNMQKKVCSALFRHSLPFRISVLLSALFHFSLPSFFLFFLFFIHNSQRLRARIYHIISQKKKNRTVCVSRPSPRPVLASHLPSTRFRLVSPISLVAGEFSDPGVGC